MILRASSNLIKRIDKIKPTPLIKRTKRIPTKKTTGNIGDIFWPEIMQTIMRGINPIKKLINAAIVVDNENSCTLTFTFVMIDLLFDIDSAERVNP